MDKSYQAARETWPSLEWLDWAATAETLHMWTQIVGKTRLALAPMQQHWWNVPLYVSARGLTTSPMPVASGLLEIEFDFIAHHLLFRLSTGETRELELRSQTVSAFFQEYQTTLTSLGLSVPIHPVPVEVKDAIPFAEDTTHDTYDPEAAHSFWRVLVATQRVFQEFSSEFIGKISPVHFFWGSFDLAVSRFSGRPAPLKAGTDAVTAEAYSEEVISAGFWPGNGGFGQAAFYSYIVPAPEGISASRIDPAAASFDLHLGEFIFPYQDLRSAPHPNAALMQFLQSTYESAAGLADWERSALERGDRIPMRRKRREIE